MATKNFLVLWKVAGNVLLATYHGLPVMFRVVLFIFLSIQNNVNSYWLKVALFESNVKKMITNVDMQ